MHFLSPISLDEVVAFENALNCEVILLVALVKEGFLNNGKF